jgi:putative acetyltransferase
MSKNRVSKLTSNEIAQIALALHPTKFSVKYLIADTQYDDPIRNLPAKKEQYRQLIQLWERSVRATHHFLSEADISNYRPLILEQYFDQLDLFCFYQQKTILGFIGLDQKLIQMLFIDPEFRGTGVGKALIKYAIEHHQVDSVDVNEQNEQAIGFYKHLDFQIVDRFEEDALGKPYPILSMQLKQQ